MSVSIVKYQKQDVAIAAAGRWRDIHTANINVADDCLTRNGSACPICGGTDRFNVDVNYDQTGTVHCRGCTIGGDGFTFLMKANNWRFPKALQAAGEFLNVKPVIHGVETTQRDIASDAETFHQMAIAQNKLEELSQSIGVSVRALQELNTGWNGEAWTFPETDAHGNVIGINRRFPDGSKKQYKGHKRGLMLADAGHDMLYCVEGASDTAAMIDCGLSVIARPSNNGGSAHLSELLRDETRTVFIVGENDQKEIGTWPGLEGALSIASKLKLADVRIALPADGVKDIRDWCSRFPDGDILESLETLTIEEAQARLPQKKATSEQKAINLPSIAYVHGQTDSAHAARFIDAYHRELLYVPPWRKWLSWDGQRWHDDSGVGVMQRAKKYGEQLWRAVEIIAPVVDRDDLAKVVAAIKAANQSPKIKSILELAAVDERVVCTIGELNADPALLNVANGTIDLATGKLRQHNPADRITQLANVVYDQSATCLRWLETLSLIFDDTQDLIRYVQRLLGYSISGDTGEHILPMAYGSGCNGKSTVWNAITELLGDYASLANDELLMGETSSHPTDKAALYQKRFVAISEPERNSQLRESRVKELTGDRKVTCRRMREDFWTFDRTHTFWLSTNHLPRIDGTDEGIWRRVKLIPFNVDLRDKVAPIPDFDQWLVKNEGPGILAWLVRGYLDYRENGLIEPDCVREATGKYRSDSDPLGDFLAEYCIDERGAESTATELFEAYQRGGGKWSKTAFGRNMAERFTKGQSWEGKHRGKVVYQGVRLRDFDDEITRSTEVAEQPKTLVKHGLQVVASSCSHPPRDLRNSIGEQNNPLQPHASAQNLDWINENL